MSKELEALRNFISECENDWKTQPKRLVDGAINSNVSKYMYSLKSILTPPTAEEVCKALSERYNNAGIQYLQDDKRFVFGYMLKPICWLKEDGTVYWGTNDLPPHLITLIGRFYEGEIKWED